MHWACVVFNSHLQLLVDLCVPGGSGVSRGLPGSGAAPRVLQPRLRPHQGLHRLLRSSIVGAAVG